MRRRDELCRRMGLVGWAAAAIALSGCSASTTRGDAEEEYYRDVADTGEIPRRSTGAEGEDGDRGAEEPLPPVLVRRSPTSRGSLGGEEAGRAIFEGIEPLQRCYAAAGGEEAGRGVVFVLLDVEASGAVDGVLVGHSDIADLRFLSCVEDRLAELSMPASPGSSVVQAYLVFGSAREEEGRQMLSSYRSARASATEEAEAAQPLTAVREAVEGCYERAIVGREGEAARLVLELTVDEDGAVTSVAVSEDNLGGEINACVITVVEKLRLEVGDDRGSTFVYPVIISASRDAGTSTSPSATSGARSAVDE